jgi:hypothetical protein
MGNACAAEESPVVAMHSQSTINNGGDDSATSMQYQSRRTSAQTGIFNRGEKYTNESEEDRFIRLKVFDACMTGRVKNVQELVDEHGEQCLDLRSTSLMDDIGIEPLACNVSRYRKARQHGSPSGIASSVNHPAGVQEVLERSMGIVKGSTSTRQRRPLPPPPALQMSTLRTGLTIPSHSPPAPSPDHDDTGSQALPDAVPHVVVTQDSGMSHSPSAAAATGTTRKSLSVFSPLENRSPLSIASDRNEISVADAHDLQEAARVAAGESPIISPKSAASTNPSSDATSAQNSNSSPMIVAGAVGSRELAAYLMLRGQDLNEVVHHTTALIAAVRNAQSAHLVRFLLSRGAKAHLCRGQIERQALHYAAEIGDIAVVRELLANKAVVNWLSRDGMTALHLAVRKGFSDVVKLLIEHGADPGIREAGSGLNCYDVALAQNFGDLSTFLKHQKRSHPTQFGTASAYKANNGIINGTVESDMFKSAKAAASLRPQAIKEYADGEGSFGIEKSTGLNPALSRSAGLVGVPSNPPVKQVEVERSKTRIVNPNTIAKSMEVSSRNPRPAGEQASPSMATPGVLPGFEVMGYAVGYQRENVEDGGASNAAKVQVPGLGQDSVPASQTNQAAKAMFHQHGWSEKTFHTNMSRKRSPHVIAEVEVKC